MARNFLLFHKDLTEFVLDYLDVQSYCSLVETCWSALFDNKKKWKWQKQYNRKRDQHISETYHKLVYANVSWQDYQLERLKKEEEHEIKSHKEKRHSKNTFDWNQYITSRYVRRSGLGGGLMRLVAYL